MSLDNQNIKTVERKDVLDIVSEAVAELFFLEKSTIKRATRFDEDLAVDDDAFLALIDQIEVKLLSFSVSLGLNDELIYEMETIGDLVDSVWNEVVAIVGVQQKE